MPRTSFAETQVKRIYKGQAEYSFDGSFDRIAKVRRLDENMEEIDDLDILDFPDPDKINSDEDLIPPPHSSFFRPNDSTSSVYIRDDETRPEDEGATFLEVTFVNTFCRAVVDSEANINLLKAAEKGASTGVRPMRVERPDIDTVQGCQEVAEALRAEFEKVPLSVGPVRTRQKGLESGQTFEYTTTRNKLVVITIIDIEQSVLEDEWVFDLNLSYVIVKTPKERANETMRRVKNPLVPRKTIIDKNYLAPIEETEG